MKKYLLIATCCFVSYNAAAGIIMGVAKGAAIGYAAHKGAQYLEDKDKEKMLKVQVIQKTTIAILINKKILLVNLIKM